jgi:signal transduction histidine kinase/CheY-like chemotaxis protein
MFVVDNGLVAIVVAIEQNKPFRKVWSDSFRWALVSYFTSLSFALAIALLYKSLGIMGFAFGLAPVWMLLSFFKIQKQWQAEHQTRVEQAEQLNRVLEWKVHERTRELQAALGTVEDTNSKLTVANEALTEASKTKSEFLANVSHELRTPLNAIIGFSEVLSAQDTEGLSDRQLDFLKAIHDGGDHLLSLINDILDLSKIESSRMPLNLDVVEVGAIVSEVASMLKGQAEKNDLVLSAECGDGIGPVSVDQRLFREVLLNLMSNAIKFTPAGGSVRVLARMEGCDLVVQVVDSGIGIAREDQARVFEQFYQVDGTYTRKFRGTGLGLGLVRRMVEMHGGTVAVESESGEGATFTCRFPDCRVNPPREASKPSLLTQGGGGESCPYPESSPGPAPSAREGQRTVLVVDSDPLNRRLAANALKTKDYRVLEASGCTPALDILRVQHVDLALVALKMDGADGYALAREVLNEPAARTVSLVAMAGAEATDPVVIQESGCDGLIAAPVQINRLPHQVRSYLERKEHVA